MRKEQGTSLGSHDYTQDSADEGQEEEDRDAHGL